MGRYLVEVDKDENHSRASHRYHTNKTEKDCNLQAPDWPSSCSMKTAGRPGDLDEIEVC